MNKPKVIAVVGPTASGKTSLSIKLAKEFKGEVISADSRQVYKGMDIGSGKVTVEEMDGIPHHVLDVAEPMEVFTAKDFVDQAGAAIDSINSRACLPIIAGGTFFYVDLLRGKMQAAPVEPDEDFRASLEQYSDTELFELLEQKDPRRAAKIDRYNRRRLERALEIIHTLGTVPEPKETESPYDWLIFGIDISQEQLHDNIHIRLIERMEEGMVEEVEQLHKEGVSWQRLDTLGLEYRYIAQYLQGILDKETMLEQLETKIKQFAKRQMTWLKKDDEIHWVGPGNFFEISRLTKNFLAE